jgi:heme exporter protein C
MLWNRSSWWKILAVLLIGYILTAGLLVPLGAGISSLSSFSLNEKSGYALEAKLYNLDIGSSSAQAYLRFGDHSFLPAKNIQPIEKSPSVRIEFNQLSSHQKQSSAITSLIIVDERGKKAVLPEAVRYVFSEGSPSLQTQVEANPGFISNERFEFPYRNILVESIRNLFYHVPMWFAMIILSGFAFYYSISYLKNKSHDSDRKVFSLVSVAFLLGVLGLTTGSIWAKHTWGTYWTADVKLNMSALVVMMYGAYLLMRVSIGDPDNMKKNTAAYNIFCFIAMIPLLFIVPRLQDSLHPGNGGNPGFGGEDLDGYMRLVFYPAVIAWTLMGFWLTNLLYRIEKLDIQSKLSHQ